MHYNLRYSVTLLIYKIVKIIELNEIIKANKLNKQGGGMMIMATNSILIRAMIDMFTMLLVMLVQGPQANHQYARYLSIT